MRAALLAHDAMFKGDEAAFCEAYSNGNYAPDIQVPIMVPPGPTM